MNKTAALFSHLNKDNFKDLDQIIRIFSERNISLEYVQIHYEKIDETIQSIKDYARKTDFLIGDSIASFYIRHETNSNARILINPVMKFSEAGIFEQPELLQKTRKMEEFIDWYTDAEIRSVTYAVFEDGTPENPSSDQKAFISQYGWKLMDKDYNYCSSDRIAGIKKALDFFENMGMLNYHRLREIAKIGEFLCDNNLFLINVYGGEEIIPHFHIINSQTHDEGCIRIDRAEYYSHGKKEMKLNSEQKKALVEFLNTVSPYEEDHNQKYYYLIWEEWNRNNREHSIDRPASIPNYKEL